MALKVRASPLAPSLPRSLAPSLSRSLPSSLTCRMRDASPGARAHTHTHAHARARTHTQDSALPALGRRRDWSCCVGSGRGCGGV
eukprot:436843-Rhodomonas_salina.1